MKSYIGSRPTFRVASWRHRFARPALFALCAAGAALVPSHAQTSTSAVPGFIAYSGKVIKANGTPEGAGTPVNRKVIFRIWDHASNSTVTNLVYSEEQTVTISEGEFSVLIGQGGAVTGTPLGYSESAKGPSTTTIASAAVFGGATRFLGVTIDDGTATADPEVSPRQQLVTTGFAFRAKYAESVGSNGVSTITTLDNGNVGIGSANPGAKLEVAGTIRAGGAGVANPSLQLLAFSASTVASSIGYAAGAGNFSTDAGIGDTVFRTDNGGRLLLQAGGGASALVVGTNNFVGIGTTSPSAPLHIKTTGGDAATIEGTTAVGYSMLSFKGTGRNFRVGVGNASESANSVANKFFVFDSDTADTNKMRLVIDTSGNVGIGTPSPSTPLHIKTSGGDVATVEGTTAAGYSMVNFKGTGRNFRVGVGNASESANSVANKFFVFDSDTADTNKMRLVIDTSGNVGIGASNPSSKLHVEGTTFLNGSVGIGTSIVDGRFSVNSVTASATTNTAEFKASGINSGNASSHIHYGTKGDIYWRSAATDGTVVLQDTGGNVGIGTNSPTAKLDVAGSYHMNSSGTFSIDSSAAFKILNAGTLGTSNGTGADSTTNITGGRFFIGTDGKIGIGTNTPETTLHIANRGVKLAAFYRGARGEPAAWGDVDETFDIANFGGTNSTAAFWGGRYTALTVDARIKVTAIDITNIQTDSDRRIKAIRGRSQGKNDLETLLRLQVTDYAYKDTVLNGTKPQKKLIAQEVEDVFPQAVSQGSGIIPDIYRFAGQREGWIALETDLKVGERVRVIGDIAGMALYEVLEVQPGRFRVAYKQPDERVLVYGREVGDFRSLDYEAISMLNVSATQELARQNDALRTANEALTKRVADLESMDRVRDAKLASIERLLQANQTVMASPAAASRASANGQE